MPISDNVVYHGPQFCMGKWPSKHYGLSIICWMNLPQSSLIQFNTSDHLQASLYNWTHILGKQESWKFIN